MHTLNIKERYRRTINEAGLHKTTWRRFNHRTPVSGNQMHVATFAIRVVRHCHRLPREVVDAPTPGSIQGEAVWGSEHLMELKVSLFIAGELD